MYFSVSVIMTRHLFFCILTISVLASCKEEEENHPEQSDPNSSLGRYEYNFIEKDIVDGFVRATGDSILVLTLIDEDNKVMNARLLNYETRTTFTYPGEADELVAEQQHEFNETGGFLGMSPQDTSFIQISNQIVMGEMISGNFDLTFSSNLGASMSLWENGHFNNVPFIEITGIPAEGMDYHYTYNQIFIDSIFTRFTNTYKLEIYIYAKQRFGFPIFELIRWNVSEDGLVKQPDTAYYHPFSGVKCGLILTGDFSYDPVNEELNSNVLEGTELVREMQIRFMGLPPDQFPLPYSSAGELILYHQNNTIIFEAVQLNTNSGASPILEAENNEGNRLEVYYSDSETNKSLNYPAHKPGAEVELAFWENPDDSDPAWIVSGFMDVENMGNEKVNIGFETSFLPRESEQTIIRGLEIEL